MFYLQAVSTYGVVWVVATQAGEKDIFDFLVCPGIFVVSWLLSVSVGVYTFVGVFQWTWIVVGVGQGIHEWESTLRSKGAAAKHLVGMVKGVLNQLPKHSDLPSKSTEVIFEPPQIVMGEQHENAAISSLEEEIAFCEARKLSIQSQWWEPRR